MIKMINLTVNDDNQNKRVDSFISSIKKDISRSKIKSLIEKGFLKIYKMSLSIRKNYQKLNVLLPLQYFEAMQRF